MSPAAPFNAHRRKLLAMALVASVLWLPMPAHAQSEPAPTPEVEDLGEGRFQVGQIVVDRTKNAFSVPAKLLDQGVQEAPLEFLVVTRNGPKAYEALLELDATAYEFNVACLLIGLNPDNAKLPKGNFEPGPAEGDPVTLFVGPEDAEEGALRPVTDLLRVVSGEAPENAWVYLGSYFDERNIYTADFFGLAVGFVNDRESIIQHVRGIGLESYGAVVQRPVEGIGPDIPLKLIVSRP